MDRITLTAQNRRPPERERVGPTWRAIAVRGLATGFYWAATAIAALMVVVGFVRYSVGWIADAGALMAIWFLAALIWFVGWGFRKFTVR
jgi:hypothetical protein